MPGPIRKSFDAMSFNELVDKCLSGVRVRVFSAVGLAFVTF